MIHAAVAVIINDGSVLISKRPDHVHQGGLWEFPGGKVEDAETIETALFREIQEELGINIKASRPLIKLAHCYPDKSVLLETRLITDFDGREYGLDKEQLGLERQLVKWVDLNKLDNYQFPAANKPILSAIQLPESYLISPDCSQKPETFLQQLSMSIQDNSLLQLRIKSLHGDKLDEMLKAACKIALKKQSRILINSSMKVSDEINSGASGIHLTSHHLHKKDFAETYQAQFPEKMTAASCHNKEDIERANQLSLDFIVISPVQQTVSHPQQASLGWDNFKSLTDFARIPVFALGGLRLTDIPQAQNHGAQGIAAIRGLWNRAD